MSTIVEKPHLKALTATLCLVVGRIGNELSETLSQSRVNDLSRDILECAETLARLARALGDISGASRPTDDGQEEPRLARQRSLN